MIQVETGRIYTHYKHWEDYQHGLFKKQSESRQLIDLAVKNLSTPDMCRDSMELVIKQWPVSTAVNLSIPGCQRPWLGRASNCIRYAIAENITRIAWWQLSIEQQESANNIADEIIDKWRKKHQTIQENLFNG